MRKFCRLPLLFNISLFSFALDSSSTYSSSDAFQYQTTQASITRRASPSSTTTTALGEFKREAIKKKPHAYRNTDGMLIVDQIINSSSDGDDELLGIMAPIDPIIQKRDRALLALYTNLDMTIVEAANLVDKYPQFYKDISSLASRLHYLLAELHISKAKLRRMMLTHPTMMLKVMLEDPERSLISTAEVLQRELHMTLSEISQQQQQQMVLSMDRLDLKEKLHYLKQYFQVPQLQQLIRKHSDLLTDTPQRNKNPEEVKAYIRALSDELEWSKEEQELEAQDTLQTADPLLMKRDRALLALQSHLGMDLATAMCWLNDFPQLYTDIPSLTTRLLFLSTDLNLKPAKVVSLMQRHPTMMVRVLLEDPEVTLHSTIQVLQGELQMSLDQIMTKHDHLLQLDRMDLKSKLTHLQQFINTPTLKKIILKHPSFLGTSLEVMKTTTSLLQGQLQLSDTEIGAMIKKNPRLLTVDRIEERISEWTTGLLGQGLRSIDRRGVLAAEAPTPQEADRIQHLRAKEILLKQPELLLSDQVPVALHYLVQVGGDAVHLGKIAYRRSEVLTYSLELLVKKVKQISVELGLPMKRTADNGHEKIAIDVLAGMPDILTNSVEENLQPKFDFFRHEIGMSTAEMRKLFSTRPQILTLKLDGNLREKIEYFRNDVGLSPKRLRMLLNVMPDCLRQNLENRIKPRCAVILEHRLTIPDDLPNYFFRATDVAHEKWKLSLTVKTIKTRTKSKDAKARSSPKGQSAFNTLDLESVDGNVDTTMALKKKGIRTKKVI